MTLEDAYAKIISDVKSKILNNFKVPLYIGKTIDIQCRREEQCKNPEENYPYTLFLAYGDDNDIANLESKIIDYFMISNTDVLLNKNKKSSGNKKADKFYICLNKVLPKYHFTELNTMKKLFLVPNIQ